MPHTRPARASLTLRPVGLLSRPRRPLSRGFNPAGCPAEPLVSYQRNRQLAGWNLPPLVNRAVWAHLEYRVRRNSTTEAHSLAPFQFITTPCSGVANTFPFDCWAWRVSSRTGVSDPEVAVWCI